MLPSSRELGAADSRAQVEALETRIQQFMQGLPRLGEVEPSRVDRAREFLVIHTLCHCATVQLHASREQPPVIDTSRSLAAANAAADALRIVDVARLRFVDPILGVNFSTALDFRFLTAPFHRCCGV